MELKPEVAEEGELWSARAKDWAAVQEKFLDPCYLEILDRTEVGPATSVLDVGCGAGRFLQLASDRGAAVTGLEAAPGMLEIAHSKIPDGNFQLGDMESLPFEDNVFDLVTGFNSFSHADDPVKALREAGRVARPAAPVAITVWGPSERGSMRTAVWEIVHSLMAENTRDKDKHPGGSSDEPMVHSATAEEHVHSVTADDDLEELVKAAGLAPGQSGEVECLFVYPDEETLLKGLMSAGPFVEVSRRAGEDKVGRAILGGMQQFKRDSGGYSYSNKFRYLIATSA